MTETESPLRPLDGLDARPLALQPPQLTDTQALDVLSELLDGREWSGSDLDAVADIVRRTGRPVRDPNEQEKP